jgi:diaminopimelate epimerase
VSLSLSFQPPLRPLAFPEEIAVQRVSRHDPLVAACYTPHMRITKMHGLGNDYIYIRPERELDWHDIARRVSDRHFGVGADGLILALPSEVADLRMRMFNADGSEAEMCGNGIRCLAKYAIEEGMVRPDIPEVTIETGAGILALQLFRDDGVVTGARVDMGRPRFEPAEIPANVEGPAPIMSLPVEAGGMGLRLTLVSMGNPHAIHYVEEGIEDFPLERIGPLVERHPLFPRRTNFQVVQVLDRGHVKHRVWERGSGITLASGTSAAAVCVASRLHGFTGDRIVDSLPGGDLVLEWDGEGPVFMTGPATRVFDGEWHEA